MAGYLAGLITGCLIGIGGTLVLLLLSAALTEELPSTLRFFPARWLAFVVLLIPGIAVAAHLLQLHKSAAVLLLMLSVLAVSKLGGLVTGLCASATAALVLTFLYLPPVGSFLVESRDDRILLALFLLSGILGSRILGSASNQLLS